MENRNYIQRFVTPNFCNWLGRVLLISIFHFSFSIFSLEALAQNQEQEDNMSLDPGDDWKEHLADEEEATVSMVSTYDNLTELAQQPLDINKVTAEQLLQIPTLTEQQANDIVLFRHRYGDFKTMNELSLIPSLDDKTIKNVSRFLKIPDETAKKRFKNTLAYTMMVPTYKRAGDGEAYLGDNLTHSFRYILDYGDNISFRLTGSKTAGEPFFEGRNKWGYDLYAFNVSIRNQRLSRTILLQQAVVGQYRGMFGMGLTYNNGMSISKTGITTTVGRRVSFFTPHSSTSDLKYNQGGAVTLQFGGHVTASAFVSYRCIDATLNADSTISSVVTTGYHRTETEMAKKNNSKQMAVGAHVCYEATYWGIGVSMVHTSFDRDLDPTYSTADSVANSKLYRLYNQRGRHFTNASVDYHAQLGNFILNGETAVDEQGYIATINSLSFQLARNLQGTAVQRYYDYRYNAFYGRSLGSSTVKNESGGYLGLQYKPSKRWTFEAYTDLAYSPWLKYRISQSSYAWDNSLNVNFNPNSNWTLSARYRFQLRQRDHSGQFLNHYDNRLRFIAQRKGQKWDTRVQAEGAILSFDSNSEGFLFAGATTYKPTKRWKISGAAVWFNTDSYDSRLYAYEPSLQYTYGSTAYYYRGYHAMLMATATLAKWLTMSAKVTHTRYTDHDTIGTGNRLIDANNMTNVYVQGILKL